MYISPLLNKNRSGKGGGGSVLRLSIFRLQKGMAFLTLPVNNNLRTCNLHCLLYSRLYSNIITSLQATPEHWLLADKEQHKSNAIKFTREWKRSGTWQRGWARNPVKTKIAVQAGVYKCLLPFICFSYGVNLSVVVTCYTYIWNIVYNSKYSHWEKTLGRPRAPQPEPEPFRVHSSRWGVIPIFDSW